MPHRRPPTTRPNGPTDPDGAATPGRLRPRWSNRHRRTAAALAGVLAAGAALAGGVVVGQSVAGAATAASAPKNSPYGAAEHMWFHPGGMTFYGWAIDPSSPKHAITAYVAVDGKVLGRAVANQRRTDVARRYPSAGPNHGFGFFVRIPEGRHTVCVRARNIGAGANVVLRCQTRTLDYGPLGAVQKLTAAHGSLTVSGWTADWDNRTAPLTVAVSVDGKTTRAVADRVNTGAQKLSAAAGTKHGFVVTAPVAQGKHTVCVRATNLGYGTDTAFPCASVTLNDSPRAALDPTTQTSGKLRIRGWAFDPDAPTTAATVVLTVDGTQHVLVANASRPDVGRAYPSAGNAHGYDVSYALAEGAHTVCVSVRNVSFGSDVALPCRSAVLNFTPTASTTALTATPTGLHVTGWATDPDTSAPISVVLSVDGSTVRTITADRTGSVKSGHQFIANIEVRSGAHQVCVVARNVLYGTHDSSPSCRTIDLALNPLGSYDSLTRVSGSNDLKIAGWAWDPDTAAASSIVATLDGVAQPAFATGAQRTDIGGQYPSAGDYRGFAKVLTTSDGEHTVCIVARNVGGGSDADLGCKLINAVHPVAPSVPQQASAQAGYGGATISWAAPASDGGAPWSKYVVTAAPGSFTSTVGASTTTATITGLKPSTTYTFTVTAVNVAGTSAAATTAAVTTQASPPAQNTPAPVSTSRYIRNIHGSSPAELSTMRAEGASDAGNNPTGHGYLVLLDIGGQDNVDGGVVLSATTRFVSYTDLVRDVESYIDGYASKQRPSAPAMIALGTNNDMEVSSTSGKGWADRVVDPVVAYVRAHHPGIQIAGANDVEPGFRATYTQTKAWLTGYLGATSAPFVFNGSADGCAWTTTNRGCNNGWSMSGLYNLAAGAAPIRMLSLPQIYNYTMADQWKYISLTGVANGQPRINFAGTLTEYTACVQSGGCGSISGRSAWSRMWSNLQSDSRLRVGSLPYATDLRVDR